MQFLLYVHLAKQREMYNNGTLELKRHKLLEEKSFVFEPGTNVEKTVIVEAWKRNYQELLQFKRDNGHLEVRMKVAGILLRLVPGILIQNFDVPFECSGTDGLQGEQRELVFGQVDPEAKGEVQKERTLKEPHTVVGGGRARPHRQEEACGNGTVIFRNSSPTSESSSSPGRIFGYCAFWALIRS